MAQTSPPGHVGFAEQSSAALWAATSPTGIAVSLPPSAQPQQSSWTRAQSVSTLQAPCGGAAQAQVKQPFASVTNPSAQLTSHATGAQTSSQWPTLHAATSGLPQSFLGGHETSLHARAVGSLVGTAWVGQSQHFGPSATQSAATRHSAGAPCPPPAPSPPLSSPVNASVSSGPEQPAATIAMNRTTNRIGALYQQNPCRA
jgi:hypothetical protein